MVKTSWLTVRVTPAQRTAFERVARQYGTPSDVLRELVIAMAEGRVTVKRPAGPINKLEKMYHVD